ncbi:hypothetical protein B0T10DRAFT_411258 [Thelonectria olida]|uniref:Uncharacterized protein n=1 Tax=Thelonectria olida TaxID=1576542 RepID=A0A9P8VWN8_9HYPO|nr:hypothetical protein B0T10DRAFT_411258 [Thelonectria olida]
MPASCSTINGPLLIHLFEQKKRTQKKKAPPIGSARDFPCRPCVTRAAKSPGHECTSQNNTGAACWDCARNGHTCRPVPTGAVAAVRAFWELNRQIDDANKDPGDGWRSAAQRAAQQLRACGAAVNHSPAGAQACAPALAPRGEAGEITLEERKVAALEVIAEAARLWTQLNKPDEEGRVEEEEEDEDN